MNKIVETLKNIDYTIFDEKYLKLQTKDNPTNFLTILQVGKDLYNVDLTSGSIKKPNTRGGVNSTWSNLGDKYHNYNELLVICNRYGIK